MHQDEEEEIGTSFLGPFVVLADACTIEKEMISTRTLALTRFQRNHELMDEVFMQAALGSSTPLNLPLIQTNTLSTI
jgi:hypothetical protein